VLIPILCLKGISTGDFGDALIALLGKDAGGLSASTIDTASRTPGRSMRAG
jgi:putative transposase